MSRLPREGHRPVFPLSSLLPKVSHAAMGSVTEYGTWVVSGASNPLRGECFQKGDPSRLAQEALLGVASEDILISSQDEGHCQKCEILHLFRQQRCAARKKKTVQGGGGGGQRNGRH